MDVDAEGAEHEAAAPTECGNDTGFARTYTLEPTTPECGRYAKHHEEKRVHPAEACNAPVTCCREQFLCQRYVRARFGSGQTDRARQWQPEHREPVGHADAKMDAKRRRRHQPAIEAGRCNDAFAVKNSDATAVCKWSIDCRHA